MRRGLPALAAALALAAPGGAAAAQKALTFHAAFGPGARLGASTAIVFSGDIADRRIPVIELRLLTPAGVDLASSGLGVASCTRPRSDILSVVVPAADDSRPCPVNSLMGLGSAVASLDMEPRIDGTATLDVYAGGSVEDKPGLVIVANTYNPVRFHLFYQGYLYIPPPGYGVGVAILLPQAPQPPFGAALMLSHVRAAIGGSGITYTKTRHGHRETYHPRGVTLPEQCPRSGFRFRLIARFADGARRQADAVVACPKR
ncbi:hypothetical protein [Conexibacter woesei]|uniref:hypothetical protein n=1 Tax=Conexibacter woesei TaxID=191495 RepID=UPI0004243F75|nr:hypothetical protein [Conexibacter woesei]